ncbi:protocatechuate 3,4-dioxygenase subunit alpha [Hymenobacter caeli]|uniref:Protocatechuate 3,4-dioxygenase alpha subunit n=1 Tax=Hymenobacter caeli TaxID=2735894 RepID=A0ABX2FV40_9BACT|nr:protocatechuate 3,4-dioxygenase subunit alpha [Hymenobacter caeli]NRT20827.1 protocatechuate 3,4-dioxygenase alpha subunit [Hymenobacter caeli]
MERLRQTPSQTVGPFFAYSLTAAQYGYPYDSIVHHALLGPATPGEHILLTGRVLDGQGTPVPDAVVELWQADAQGHYRTAPLSPKDDDGSEFTGFGRVGTGTQAGARFQFETIKPGAPAAGQAPHINVTLFMRGSLRALHTRLYFSDETAANAHDELLNAVPPERRETLLAQAVAGLSRPSYHFDIRLQGEGETVFFDL